MFQRIVVPVDDTPLTEHLLAYAAQFAERFDARVTLLHAFNWSERFAMVDAPVLEVAADGEHREERAARVLVEGHAQALRARGLTVDTVVMDAPPAQAILEVSCREPETLVVIGTRDRNWLARVLRGNTLHDMLQRFHVPVLVIHQDDQNRASSPQRHRGHGEAV